EERHAVEADGCKKPGGMGARRVPGRGRQALARARPRPAGAARRVPERGQLREAAMGKTTIRTLIGAAALAPALAAAQSAPGVYPDKIVLGQSAVFSGPAAQLGIQMRNGIKSYLDYV